MLLNGGEIDGVRLLSPKTVELMTVNHVGTLFAERGPNDAGRGFGLGFDVIEDLGKTGQYGSVGAFGWGGAYHTTYWADPKEKMVVLLMTQLLPAGNSDLHAKFRALVYQSIVGPSHERAPHHDSVDQRLERKDLLTGGDPESAEHLHAGGQRGAARKKGAAFLVQRRGGARGSRAQRGIDARGREGGRCGPAFFPSSKGT